jgi:integrin beta 2
MLERTALDGSNRTTLVQQKIVYPYGVTVDYPTQHVYWVDTYLDFVERIDYDGSNRRTVKKGFPVRVRKRYRFSRRFSIFSLENDLEEKLFVTFT